MKIYNPNRFCPKCGYEDVSTSYVKNRYDMLTNPPPELEIDCIVRCCKRCHYQWVEMPLDTYPHE